MARYRLVLSFDTNGQELDMLRWVIQRVVFALKYAPRPVAVRLEREE